VEKNPDVMPGDRARCAIEVALLGVAVSIAYANAFAGVFQFDDYFVIVENPVVHSWSAWWADLVRGGIRPVLKLSYLLNYTTGGLFGFHLFNVTLHFCNTLLVYTLSRLLLAARPDYPHARRFIPLLTALVFAIHPMQVEAVTYITGRSSSLMSFFYLGTLLCYGYGRSSGRSVFVYLVGPSLFLLAFATKETGISLPVALLLFDVAIRKHPFSLFIARNLRGHVIYWLVALACVFVAITHPGYRRLLMQTIFSTNLYEAVLTQAHGVCHLLFHAALPTSLNIDPDLSVIRTLSIPVAGEMLFIIGGLVLGLITLRRYPHLGFAILWFLFHTFLVYSVAARTDVINERHLYLASWGLCLLFAMALAGALRAWPRGQKALWLSACCIVLLLMGATIARNRIFASEVLLWQDTVKKSPVKARVHNNLGYAYYLSGNYEKAREAYIRALKLNPRSVVTRNNLLQLDAGGAPPLRTEPRLPPRI
jgi:hypothetical protein